ncbi:TrbC family F-type conjugative pilus assembly protein [Sulfurimonas indica]|uniref:TrbC family F-type conjugative pilus assembly protein n=1 Tax=Sulfurimonas TaxID=202746 RepID=UPI00165FF0C2|nr:TrbC family F-type conjugative pilus assembly protein [Sulfurimonas indica]
MIKKFTLFYLIALHQLYALSLSDMQPADMSYLYNKEFNKKLPNLSLKKDDSLHPTLLYFFSKSVTSTTLKNFLSRANKLKDIKTYVVFRGFDQEAKEIMMKQDKQRLLVKIHPFLYTELHIEKVPVVVYALCPDEFRYKQCKYLLRMDGDMSLNKFFEVASKQDENLLRYYNILENDGVDDDKKNN